MAPAVIAVTVAGEGFGPGTLRTAVATANAIPASTIVFAVDDMDMLNSPLVITAPTTINATGHKVTIDGGIAVRDFVVVGPINVAFIGDVAGSPNVFSIQNGLAAGGNGGGIWAADPGAAISLNTMELVNNTATATTGVFTTGNGGGVYSGGSLGIYNSVVDANTAGNFGGGAYAGKQLIVDSSIVEDNTALNGAGVYEASVSPVNISGTTSFTTFVHNNTTVGGNGGAVWAYYDVTTIFTNFDQNSASVSGGAIYSLNGNVNLNIGTNITNNVAGTGNGGGVFAFKNIVATSVIVANNTAGPTTSLVSEGGGLCAALGSVTVGGGSFIGYVSPTGVNHGNSAAFGGGIFANKDIFVGGLAIVGGNTANVDGGGAYSLNGNVTIDPSYVTGNVALGSGAGIGLGNSDTGTVTIISSFVYLNTASVNGGGISAPVGNIITVLSAIFGNHAADLGGGVYDGTGSVQLFQPTVIDSNTAAAGGGIYIDSGADLQTGSVWGAPVPALPVAPVGSALAFYTMQLTNFPHTIIISFNQAIAGGGGIDAQFSQGVTVVNTWFTNNTVTGASAMGGGMLVNSVPNVSLSYDTFSANIAKSAQGGGLAAVALGVNEGPVFRLSVDDTTFGAWQGINNSATFGAGAYVQGYQGYFNHDTFNDNHLITSTGNGAAIYADTAAVVLIENVLADDTNSVAGGVTNSLLGFGGSGILESMGHNFSSDNSLALVVNYNQFNGDMSLAVQGLTPLGFHGGATPTYDLLPGGAAINGGDNVGPPVDQDGNFRPLFGLPSNIGSVQV